MSEDKGGFLRESFGKTEGHNPVGVDGWWICFPRVVPRRTRDYRWALGRFGIGRRRLATDNN